MDFRHVVILLLAFTATFGEAFLFWSYLRNIYLICFSGASIRSREQTIAAASAEWKGMKLF
jgi:hypothetical protein